MERIKSELLFFNKNEVPGLMAKTGSYMLSPLKHPICIRYYLFFPSLDKVLSIQGIDLLLGKRIPVEEAEVGHRYLFDFGGELFFPNNISGNVKVEIICDNSKVSTTGGHLI